MVLVVAAACFAVVLAPGGAKGSLESCVHGGTKYAEGDHFLPNDTLIKTESPRQCVQCRCRQGLVLCEVEDCPSAECEAPERDRRFCCLRCPGSTGARQEPPVVPADLSSGTVSIEADSQGKSGTDCVSGGRHLENGSVWQPVMGPFGAMACVQCRCREGRIVCARAKCGEQPCLRPRRRLGHCCPVCPSPTAPRLASTQAPKEAKRRVRCLSRTTELFVFKTANVRNDSERIEYVFLENTPERKSGLVEVHAWNLRAGGGPDVFSLRLVPRRELREGNFQIVGSISRRRFRKYSKRENKLRGNCFSDCHAKVERLENSLLDYGVNARTKCTRDEIDVADV